MDDVQIPVDDEAALDRAKITRCRRGYMNITIAEYALAERQPGIIADYPETGGTRERLSEIKRHIARCRTCGEIYRKQTAWLETVSNVVH